MSLALKYFNRLFSNISTCLSLVNAIIYICMHIFLNCNSAHSTSSKILQCFCLLQYKFQKFKHTMPSIYCSQPAFSSAMLYHLSPVPKYSLTILNYFNVFPAVMDCLFFVCFFQNGLPFIFLCYLLYLQLFFSLSTFTLVFTLRDSDKCHFIRKAFLLLLTLPQTSVHIFLMLSCSYMCLSVSSPDWKSFQGQGSTLRDISVSFHPQNLATVLDSSILGTQ